MSFLIVYLLTMIFCVGITAHTLVAPTDLSLMIKFAVYAFFAVSWLSPILILNLQTTVRSVKIYTVAAKIGYFMLGFAFLTAAGILLRDSGWYLLYYVSGKNIASPGEAQALNTANMILLAVLAIVSLYAVYAAEKKPRVIKVDYVDMRIKKPMKILLVSDLHITRMTPVQKVTQWVKQFNALQADAIVMPGDIADDIAADIMPQIRELKKLAAPYGIFYCLGNHEVYHNGVEWEAVFAGLGWQVLHNSGVALESTGVYIGGVPDKSGFVINPAQAVRNAHDNQYRILLAHEPKVAKMIGENRVDLVVSGHTHGGQIFPFNFLVKLGNSGFVAGQYRTSTSDVLVSAGAGYWGPPMRLGAPAEVVVINLQSTLQS